MRKRIVPLLVSLAGVAVLGLLIYGVSHQSASRTLDEQVAKARAGKGQYPLAPGAGEALPVLGGDGTIKLASLRGKVVMLNVWASWCEPCQEEAPLLEKADKQLQQHGGTVLGVAYKDLASDSEHFESEYHVTYPSVRDGSGAFAGSYGTDRVPESFLINREGRIVAISRGEIEKSFVENALTLADRS